MTKREKFQFVMDSPIGLIGVSTSRDRVTAVEFLDRRTQPFSSKAPFDAKVAGQLSSYFKGSLGFSLLLDLQGTDFQKRVWKVLARIAPGSVRTYGDIARELNTSPRAVGNACRSNPTPIIIPCHRVISASGIGGFAGTTSGRRLDIKRWLLNHEGVSL